MDQIGITHGLPTDRKAQQPVVASFEGGGIRRPRLMSLNGPEHGVEAGMAQRPFNRGVPRRSRKGRKR